MIVADRKKIPEIRDMIKDHRPRAAGGLRHLRDRLPGRRRARGGHPRLGPAHVACSWPAAATWWSTSAPSSGSARTPSSTSWPRASPSTTPICSLGCGAGVQALAERFPKTPVYPGLNTQFMGILESQGVWTEKCAGCGNCRLGEFAGICPITRCAKRLLNGPCGGSQDGKCEVQPGPRLRLAIDLRPRQARWASSTSSTQIVAAARLVDRPGRRPAQSGPRRPVHRRPGARRRNGWGMADDGPRSEKLEI